MRLTGRTRPRPWWPSAPPIIAHAYILIATLHRVYKVLISVLSFVIALGFIVYGLRLIALLGKMTQDVRSSLVKVRHPSLECLIRLMHRPPFLSSRS